MDQHQQDLFFASYLSNQRANQVSSQMALATQRSGLVSGFMAQGFDPAKAEALADAYMRPRVQHQNYSGLIGLALLFGIPFAMGCVYYLLQGLGIVGS